jgi:hypothetical protein
MRKTETVCSEELYDWQATREGRLHAFHSLFRQDKCGSLLLIHDMRKKTVGRI